MVVDKITDTHRVNAKPTDAFDIFNFRHYVGPNPYLPAPAIAFDFALVSDNPPLDMAEYVDVITRSYPDAKGDYDSLAHLFACTVQAVNRLDMGLHCSLWNLQPRPNCTRIAIEVIHAKTSRAVVYAVWDWFEAITRDRYYEIADQVEILQQTFRASVYGGPTVYALLKTAHDRAIPTFYLWDEGLMQYGYGKNQVRGIATTFDTDSHIDSDFTTRKDDCKTFLETLGFPVPRGRVVYTLNEALDAADFIGYPVAVKPVEGHKGEGVTAAVQDAEEVEQAFDRAVQSIPPEQSVRVIVEQSIRGYDFRLLCVNHRFVAATRRQPASVVGDGYSTIRELIEQENRTAARSDTPTSPLGKIKRDGAMERYLDEQGLSLDSVPKPDQAIYLRKVANLSAGGLSIDATQGIHPDNIILVQDVAQHFRLTCLGIDVVAEDLGRSWKDGNFSIIEINAAPGIYMHLKPAIGDSIDVPSYILKTFFDQGQGARIPIISFNQIAVEPLQEIIDHILLQHPDWTVGAVCQSAIFINRSQKNLHADYNTNVQSLLRHPKLDLLLVEYDADILDRHGMFYYGSDVVILDHPNETEMMLARDVFENSTVVIKAGNTISIQRQGLIEQYELSATEPFSRVYLKEIATIL